MDPFRFCIQSTQPATHVYAEHKLCCSVIYAKMIICYRLRTRTRISENYFCGLIDPSFLTSCCELFFIQNHSKRHSIFYTTISQYISIVTWYWNEDNNILCYYEVKIGVKCIGFYDAFDYFIIVYHVLFLDLF